MHGRRGEDWKRTRHMWTVPTRGTQIVEADGSSSSSSSAPNSFCKGGRRISVGDCALFKPPQDSPPFIGIIRWLTTGKENKLKLGVNWLYRSSELKLGKGILLEAAPNEVFYSFHKDEIPAASLLHPCKVAFLPKDVELPSGISSFVCRRVYDITNKCLWWLTDQDYINERQEEVDQLLYKTRIEMHASVQPGGRSPKPTSGPTSTSQLKANSDSVQTTAFPSHTKGKKRERSDQGLESVKRERIIKADEGDSANCRLENILKSEIAKVAEKGGLVDSEAVEKLVQLMLTDRNDKKIDLAGRSALAGVIAATDKVECLSQFVHLKGLPVLDEWLQEVHKGKIGSGGSPKDSDKAVEEFLLVLLRALDKLPVNLPALQMCNIGKSVNHLRSHKNLEIQKKARSLVDTWKKRVEAEMNINDAKSGSNQAVAWSARTRPSEVSHGGRNQDASSEVAMKSSVSQLSTSKSASVKLAQDDSVTRSASASPGSMKPVLSPASASINSKDGSSRNPGVCGTTDLAQTIARDEKSSSSSQSHNNSQSCSSEHGKSGGLGKEDARSSTAGSMSVNKISGGGSRQRKSVNGFPGPVLSGGQRDVGSGKSSLHRNTVLERSSQSGMTFEKASDGPIAEGNSPKLIVKITNRGRSPAQSASGGSFEDPSTINSRASSPPLSDKHDQLDHSKSDTCQPNITGDVNAESWQNSDVKDTVIGADDGDGSPAAVNGDECCRAAEDVTVSKATPSSLANDHKNGKLHEASFSSINALIESCIKCSEASMPTSLTDNVGMNLLASVAAVEMSKSDFVLPSDTQGNMTAVDRSSRSSDYKVKASCPEEDARDDVPTNDAMDVTEQGLITSSFGGKNVDGRSVLQSEEKPVGDLNGHSKSSGVNLQQTAVAMADGCMKMNEVGGPASPTRIPEKGFEIKGAKPVKDRKTADVVDGESSPESKPKPSSSFPDGGIVGDGISTREVEMDVLDEPLHRRQDVDGNTNNRLNGISTADQRSSSKLNSDSAKLRNDGLLQASGSSSDLVSANASGMKGEKDDETSADVKLERHQSDLDPMPSESRGLGGLCSATNHEDEHVEENLESKENTERSGGQTHQGQSIISTVQETEQPKPSKRSKLAGVEAEEAEESTSTAADAGSMSAVGVSDMDAKLEFDLNEGFNVDDGKCSEPSSFTPSGCLSTVQLISPLPLPVSNVTNNIPASITVAAAAKGGFVPPDDLLRSKGELGWKGSAATSAFRPAEPRKVLEMPLGLATTPLADVAVSKISRPPLDIDLNVPDERILEDMNAQMSTQEVASKSDLANNRDLAHGRCSGGLDLDLNRVDDAPDPSNFSLNNCRRIDTPLSVKSSTVPLNDKVNFRRDFDLNGPIVDEATTEPSIFPQHARSSMPSQASVSGLWMNNAEMGNFPSWFPPGNAYSAVAIPSILPDRAEQSFPVVATNGPPRILGPTSGSSPYSPDVFRGPVLSSSPAVPFPSATFQYPVLSFGNSFPLPSATFSGNTTAYVDSSSGGRLCFPAVPSQFLGPPGTVSTPYPRPYVVSHSDGGNNTSSDSSRKWGRQGLDLNAGPVVPDIEGREESSSLVPRQLSVAGSQATAEEHMRVYQPAIGIMKRKEPEGGWDGYKQSSW